MAMTEAELAEQERRAGMAAAGIDVGKVDGPALCAEVRRLLRENDELRSCLESLRAELERRSAVVISAGDNYGQRSTDVPAGQGASVGGGEGRFGDGDAA